ncbi:unnamed protein product [Citrullus colocynthis]|uniref:Uncharacterized protein n=1 Tax=Citrullus colocynthis TaxID=252529 RepID=A0ABP0YEH2_9ROSI
MCSFLPQASGFVAMLKFCSSRAPLAINSHFFVFLRSELFTHQISLAIRPNAISSYSSSSLLSITVSMITSPPFLTFTTAILEINTSQLVSIAKTEETSRTLLRVLDLCED